VKGVSPESQGQNLALIVLREPNSLDIGNFQGAGEDRGATATTHAPVLRSWRSAPNALPLRASTTSITSPLPAPPRACPNLFRIHFIIVMIRWTGLAPLELRCGAGS